MRKRLVLPLKKKWFDMIKSGVKKEEYRDITDYWIRRLVYLNMFQKFPTVDDIIEFSRGKYDFNLFNDFDEVEYTCGYPRKGDKERRMVFDMPTLRVEKGVQEWGATANKYYFVVKWGKRLE